MLRKGNPEHLRAFYDAHDGRLNITFDNFRKRVQDWDIWCLDESGIIAIILLKDGHGHIATCGPHIGTVRMKQAIRELDVRYTTVGASFRKGHSLVKRLGFCKVSENETMTLYERRW